MNRLPPQPLDAEERALAAQLPRLRGRSEPTPALDARILAAAHAAAQQPAKPARRRWAAPLALAASLCLAVGVAWRVQLTPPPAASATPATRTTPATAEAPRSEATAPQQVPSVGAVPSPRAQSPAAKQPPAPMQRMRPVPPSEASPVVADAPRAFAQDAAPAPAPPPLPAPAATAARAAPAAAAESVEKMANGALASPAARANDALATPSARRPEATLGNALQEQKTAESANIDAPVDDVPPATMTSPAARDAWLKRIRQLQQQGDVEAARASLAEFRRRYPQATLPAQLLELEQTPDQSSSDPAAH